MTKLSGRPSAPTGVEINRHAVEQASRRWHGAARGPHRHAIDSYAGADDFATYLRNAAGSRRVQREYPVYYSAHSDPGSREMADLFLGSLQPIRRVVPRESTLR